MRYEPVGHITDMQRSTPLRVLDLFSGIGGFSLGLERAGMRTIGFCEIDPYCRAVLKKHWPHIVCYRDIRNLRASHFFFPDERPDLICGGFPCQDISEAGKGAGITGERSGLWQEFRRLCSELLPRFILIENVGALRTRGLEKIIEGLSEIGYDAEWSTISACSVGAPHPRERMFIVAYPQGRRWQQRWGIELETRLYKERHIHHWKDQPEPPRVADGIPNRVDRNRALGNAVVPQIVEIIGRAIMEQSK